MQKIHFSIFIKAPAEKVWNIMLGESTYREWTKAFNPGSYYVGTWKEGSKMLFLGPDINGQGGESGMVSYIEKNDKHKFISIKHVGVISHGVEDTTSDTAKQWAHSYENYTFLKKNGGTEVVVDMDIEDQHKQEFDDMWPRALEALKELCEE